MLLKCFQFFSKNIKKDNFLCLSLSACTDRRGLGSLEGARALRSVYTLCLPRVLEAGVMGEEVLAMWCSYYWN